MALSTIFASIMRTRLNLQGFDPGHSQKDHVHPTQDRVFVVADTCLYSIVGKGRV
jgi:hypothetical protein